MTITNHVTRTKDCCTCGIVFYLGFKGHNKLYCSKECKRKATNLRSKEDPRPRIRNHNHSKNTYEKQKERGIKRKLQLISNKGGKCEICGYKTNLAGLLFHHIDPTLKERQLDMRTLAAFSITKLEKEIENTSLLCQNCHMEIHYPHLNMDLLI